MSSEGVAGSNPAKTNMSKEYIFLINGERFYLNKPELDKLDIDVIAEVLSKVCRFGGHIPDEPYSVAQHSVYVSRLCPPELKMAGLMHDAPEHILGDVVSPLKKLMKEIYSPLERKLMRAIAKKFGFSFNHQVEMAVKHYDLAMLCEEFAQLRPNCPFDRNGHTYTSGVNIKVWGWKKAKREFIKEYRKLNGKT